MRVEFLAADTGHKTEAWLRQEEEGHAQMRNSICNHLDQSEQQKKCCRRVSMYYMCRSLSSATVDVDVAFCFSRQSVASVLRHHHRFGSFSSFFQ